MAKNFSFDCLLLKRFFKLFVYINASSQAFVVFIFLIFLALLQEVAVYHVGMITGAYYKILGDKDRNGFWMQTLEALGLIVAVAIIKSCKEYVASTLYIDMRLRLTQKLHSLYFMDNLYYRLNVMETTIDNIDQRTTQDVDKMCKNLSLVLPDIIIAPFTIAFYSYWSYTNIGFIGPLGCIIFFLVGTIFNKLLMSPIVNLVYLQEKLEGIFRYQHMHVRNCAESVAFMSGAELEYKQSEKKLKNLVSTQESIILKELGLKSSVYLFDYLSSIVAFVILSVPLFAGQYNDLSATELSQLISQSTFVSMYLINVFSRLIDTSVYITVIGGTTHRISEFIEEMVKKRRKVIEKNSLSSSSTSKSVLPAKNEATCYFNVNNVSIVVPNNNRRIINGLNFQICKGSNLLIAGPSGTCKTSILRVLKGIWKHENGIIERFLPTSDASVILFLPQKPVFSYGSLLEQITYPHELRQTIYQSEDARNEEIIHYMRFLDLGQVLDRVNNQIERHVHWNWYDVLSPGEMQRLNFVRLFYHRPLVGVLDESTSQISREMENKIYSECRRLKITLISCGHRQSLELYHNQVLRITREDGSDPSANNWSLEKL